jgi:tetratricopeptide (TPR) repeat protein
MIFRYLNRKTKIMFRSIPLLILSLLFFNTAQAQVVGGNESKLFNLFILEKYEDVYYKAFNLSEKEKYAYNAEVHLYIVMSLQKIAENPDLEEAYPNAFKDILKYGAKFVKSVAKAEKKELETVTIEDNYEYLQELKEYILEEIYFIFVETKYSKAASLYRKGLKIFPDDENILFMAGISEVMSNNRQGQLKLDEFQTKAKEKYSNSSYEGDEVSNLYFGKTIKTYTDYLVTNGEGTEAKKWIEMAYKFQPEDETIEAQYEKLMN